MPKLPQPRRAAIVAIVLAGASACVPSPAKAPGASLTSETTLGGVRQKGTGIKAPSPVSGLLSPRPAPRPSTGTGSIAPSVAPSAPATVIASSAPASSLTAAHQTLRTTLESKLLTISKVGFNLGVGALISENSASIISNNGSGIISNNGSGYRLAMAAPVIAPDAQGSEIVFSDRLWPDGSRTRQFTKDFAHSDDYIRRMEFPAGAAAPTFEFREVRLESHPNGAAKRGDKSSLTLYADGSTRSYYHYEDLLDDAGHVLAVNLKPTESGFRDPAAGAAVDIDDYGVDAGARTGHFRYVYTLLGLTETGTLADVTVDAEGRVVLSYGDPLGYYDGTSRVTDAAGALLFTKTRQTTGATRKRVYDLGNGVVLDLTQTTAGYVGDVLLNGTKEATAKMVTRLDGTTLFWITFAEDASHPVLIGFGRAQAVDAEPTPVASPHQARVVTIAGASAGYAEGTAVAARFKTPLGLVASRVTPGKLYLADSGNHRIRALTLNAAGDAATTAPYAGSGTAGWAEGAALSAAFNAPCGLAVAADDTLYVADQVNRSIRVVAPDGTVSTLAGGGPSARGSLDGTGAAAQFIVPVALALDEANNRLYVADSNAHNLRVVVTAGAEKGKVTTLAGLAPTAGYADGTGTQARFSTPLGLALDAQGRLVVADRDNRRLRLVTPEGVVTTIAGSGDKFKAFVDGAALSGGTNPPLCLASGPAGAFYFASSDIKRLDADGKLRTFAGSTLGQASDGPYKTAGFAGIFGIAFGPGGILYATDGNTVRAVLP